MKAGKGKQGVRGTEEELMKGIGDHRTSIKFDRKQREAKGSIGSLGA